MSTKRTTVSRPPRAKITPEAVDLFRQGLELQAAGGLTSWNEDAYFELQTKLDMALGRMKPWQVNQLDADPNSPPHIFELSWQREEWQSACSRGFFQGAIMPMAASTSTAIFRCPLYPRKRTCAVQLVSALCQ